MIDTRLVSAPFDPAAELSALGDAGAVASFTGHVRADDGVATLTLEHYPGMTERALSDVAGLAMDRWSLAAVRIVHRVGTMRPGEAIVFVGAASAHRAAALAAVAFVIDRLKTDALFWKREALDDGSARWVEARASDKAAARDWDQ